MKGTVQPDESNSAKYTSLWCPALPCIWQVSHEVMAALHAHSDA